MQLEIERKYLIEKPNFEELEKTYDLKKTKIFQTYLVSPEGEERRVRAKFCLNKNEKYFYTKKRNVETSNGLIREENEREISQIEYEIFLQEANPSLSTIRKERFVFDYERLTFEVDVYEFEQDYAVMEVELPSADAEVTLPPEIRVIKEVTHDKAFKNKAISKNLCLPV